MSSRKGNGRVCTVRQVGIRDGHLGASEFGYVQSLPKLLKGNHNDISCSNSMRWDCEYRRYVYDRYQTRPMTDFGFTTISGRVQCREFVHNIRVEQYNR
jgi:hypothetical protein